MECTRQMGCMCADCSMFATVSLKEVQTKQAIDYGPEDDAHHGWLRLLVAA